MRSISRHSPATPTSTTSVASSPSKAQRPRRLDGHRRVGGAAADDRDARAVPRRRQPAEDRGARLRVVVEARARGGVQAGELALGQPREEQRPARLPRVTDDGADLRRGLGLAEHGLALPVRAARAQSSLNSTIGAGVQEGSAPAIRSHAGEVAAGGAAGVGADRPRGPRRWRFAGVRQLDDDALVRHPAAEHRVAAQAPASRVSTASRRRGRRRRSRCRSRRDWRGRAAPAAARGRRARAGARARRPRGFAIAASTKGWTTSCSAAARRPGR